MSANLANVFKWSAFGRRCVCVWTFIISPGLYLHTALSTQMESWICAGSKKLETEVQVVHLWGLMDYSICIGAEYSFQNYVPDVMHWHACQRRALMCCLQLSAVYVNNNYHTYLLFYYCILTSAPVSVHIITLFNTPTCFLPCYTQFYFSFWHWLNRPANLILVYWKIDVWE